MERNSDRMLWTIIAMLVGSALLVFTTIMINGGLDEFVTFFKNMVNALIPSL